jgi:hypothetical protein
VIQLIATPLYAEWVRPNIAKPVPPATNKIPMYLKIKLMKLAVPNLIAFFKIRIKAFQAALQKFFPVRAI